MKISRPPFVNRIFTVCLLLFILPSTALCANTSFSPIYVTNSQGRPQKLTWVYLVNGGKPLNVNSNGIALTLKISALQMVVDPARLTRTVNFSATISGMAQGRTAVKMVEYLRLSAGRTKIYKQSVSVGMDVSTAGDSANILATVASSFTPSAEWFLDRNNLDKLRIGYGYAETGRVSIKVAGDVCVELYGIRQCSDISQNAYSPESWKITGKLKSMKVGSATYSNVVAVSRNTVSPDVSNLMDLTGGINTTPVKISYWVAKGVGMIKGVGQYTLLGKPLLLELKSLTIK